MGWDVCTFERVVRKAEANDSKHLLSGRARVDAHNSETTMGKITFSDRRDQVSSVHSSDISCNVGRLWSRNGLLEICRMMV